MDEEKFDSLESVYTKYPNLKNEEPICRYNPLIQYNSKKKIEKWCFNYEDVIIDDPYDYIFALAFIIKNESETCNDHEEAVYIVLKFLKLYSMTFDIETHDNVKKFIKNFIYENKYNFNL